ncbi:MAG: hypothetical protein NWF04_02505 [Candidatus Bathyarchaeota archaeon]|nr:hypothetical protein [Candidatus Bathyarchaeota archaeon]
MDFAFQFSASWYVLFAGFLLGWLTIVVIRRKHFQKEAIQQIVLGVFGMCALISMELFAVSTNLWDYAPMNWPVILWPTYFAAVLFGYQLLRVVETIAPRK